MSIICCLDLETTSLDIKKCSITELSIALYDVKHKRITHASNYIVLPFPKGEEISDEASALTGLNKDIIHSRGLSPFTVMRLIHPLLMAYEMPRINFFAAHNGREFDEPIFKRFLKMFHVSLRSETDCIKTSELEKLLSIPWIDTRLDMPYPQKITTRKLTYLCLEHGYYIQNAHCALNDVLGMAHLISRYDFEEIKRFHLAPEIEIVAIVRPPWEDKGYETGLAKEHGFHWNGKIWRRLVKDFQVKDITAALPFKFTVTPQQIKMLEPTQMLLDTENIPF